jgi:hypothetical protein
VEAFVRAYYAAIDQSAATGDTSQLLAMSMDGCNCRRAVNAIRHGYETGSIRGMQHVVEDVRFQRVTRTEAEVVVTVHESPFEILDKAGKVDRRRPGVGRVVVAQRLRRVAGTWRVESEAVAK